MEILEKNQFVKTEKVAQNVVPPSERKAYLEKRLTALSEYIESHVNGNDQSFAEFLQEKGITREEFIKGLPKSLQNPPASGKDSIYAYMKKMNEVYTSLHDNTPVHDPSGKYMNAAGSSGAAMGYLSGSDDEYNVFFGPGLYPYKSAATFENPISGVYPSLEAGLEKLVNGFIPEYTRQMNYHLNGNDSPPLGHKGAESDSDGASNAGQVGLALDDVSFLISLYKQRIEREAGKEVNPNFTGGIDAQNATQQILQRNSDESSAIEAARNDAAERERQRSRKKSFWEIIKQDFNSIKDGLKNPPSQWFKDIAKEIKKDIADIKTNAQKAAKAVGDAIVGALYDVNRFNPAFIAARASTQALIDVNAFGIATHLSVIEQDETHWNLILKKWHNMGGSTDTFTSAVNNAKNKKRIGEVALYVLKGKTLKNLSAEGMSLADAQKAYDNAMKIYNQATADNKTKSLAATSLGILGGSSAALGATLAIIPDVVSKPVAVGLTAAGGVLASFVPIINSLKKELGLPQTPAPDAKPLDPTKNDELPHPPAPGDPVEPPVNAPTSGISSAVTGMSKTTKWIIGGTLAFFTGIGLIIAFKRGS